MKASEFFTKEEQARFVSAIKQAEYQTSGEIRVHIELKCPGEVLDRAAFLFAKLKMHKTALRNGVLFYLAADDKKFAILGDAGINQKVPANFWDEIKEKMALKFKQGAFVDGLEEAILEAGQQLKAHFPYKKDDINELSDELSFKNF